MKKPHMTKGKPERPQGKGRASGVNKPVEKASVPQVVAENRYGRPGQRQKM